MDPYLDVAIIAAKESSKIFQKYFGKPKYIKHKGGNARNFVTEIDIKIEKLIRAKIAKKFPNDKIIGEELGWEKQITKNNNIWIIDPIDGTNNFIQGTPACCISIAVWDRKGPLVGVIYNPITEELYSAQRGKGAFLNGKKISVSKITKLIDAYGGAGWSEIRLNGAKLLLALLNKVGKLRTFGSTALQLCYVASGTFDFYAVADMHIWDIAASMLIITEAGGKVTDMKNQPVSLTSSNIVGSNGKLHKFLLREIRKI
jgi:fructose-1,6-bisphosphatase/inositol monophosphatase family enzyme